MPGAGIHVKLISPPGFFSGKLAHSKKIYAFIQAHPSHLPINLL